MSQKGARASPADVAEFNKFANEFKTESDRAAVILGAAKLDILLYQLLKQVLLPTPSGRDELLDQDEPVSTFSARINLAHRLGLISPELANALHLVRRIRNSFAHELSGVSLDSGAQRDRIRELVRPMCGNWAFQLLLEKMISEKPGSASDFRAAVALLSVRLEGAFISATPLEARTAYSLLPPEPPTGEQTKVDRAT